MKILDRRLSFVGALALGLAALGLAGLGAAPASAQAEAETSEMSQEELEGFAQMMGGLFVAEPLTAQQEARLPLAGEIVRQLMPEGFYAQMMGDMLKGTMQPILGMFSGPEFVVMSSVTLEDGMPELADAEAEELAALLDPAYATRADTMIEAMTGAMEGMFAQMEPAMREGLAKAYAARFDRSQLSDIKAFFDTPTGALYARESMAIATDPQFMSSMMGAMPAMMSGMGDMEARMDAAMADIPEQRSFDDLSAAERDRAARILGITVAQLQAGMATAAANRDEGGPQLDDVLVDDWSDDDAPLMATDD